MCLKSKSSNKFHGDFFGLKIKGQNLVGETHFKAFQRFEKFEIVKFYVLFDDFIFFFLKKKLGLNFSKSCLIKII